MNEMTTQPTQTTAARRLLLVTAALLAFACLFALPFFSSGKASLLAQQLDLPSEPVRPTMRPVTETIYETVIDPNTGSKTIRPRSVTRQVEYPEPMHRDLPWKPISTTARYVHDPEVQKLVQKLRKAEDSDEKKSLTQELTERLEAQFGERQDSQREQLQEAQDRLDRLRKTLDARDEAKDEIVRRRIDELLGNPDILAWQLPDRRGAAALLPNAKIPTDAITLLPGQPVTPPMRYVPQQPTYDSPRPGFAPRPNIAPRAPDRQWQPSVPPTTPVPPPSAAAPATAVPLPAGLPTLPAWPNSGTWVIDADLDSSNPRLVYVGYEVHVKSKKRIPSFQLSDESIAEGSPIDSKTLRLRFKKAGKTTLTLKDADGESQTHEFRVIER